MSELKAPRAKKFVAGPDEVLGTLAGTKENIIIEDRDNPDRKQKVDITKSKEFGVTIGNSYVHKEN